MEYYEILPTFDTEKLFECKIIMIKKQKQTKKKYTTVHDKTTLQHYNL